MIFPAQFGGVLIGLGGAGIGVTLLLWGRWLFQCFGEAGELCLFGVDFWEFLGASASSGVVVDLFGHPSIHDDLRGLAQRVLKLFEVDLPPGSDIVTDVDVVSQENFGEMGAEVASLGLELAEAGPSEPLGWVLFVPRLPINQIHILPILNIIFVSLAPRLRLDGAERSGVLFLLGEDSLNWGFGKFFESIVEGLIGDDIGKVVHEPEIKGLGVGNRQENWHRHYRLPLLDQVQDYLHHFCKVGGMRDVILDVAVEVFVRTVRDPDAHEIQSYLRITVVLAVKVEASQQFELLIVCDVPHCFSQQPPVLQLVFGIYQFADGLEGRALVAAPPELPQYMEDVEQVLPLEGTLCNQLSEGIVDSLLFISDDNCRR